MICKKKFVFYITLICCVAVQFFSLDDDSLVNVSMCNDIILRRVRGIDLATWDIQQILMHVATDSRISVTIGSRIYDMLKAQVKYKLIQTLNCAAAEETELLFPQWVVGGFGREQWDTLAKFYYERFGYIVAREEKVEFPQDYFTIIAGKKVLANFFNLARDGVGDGGTVIWSDKDRFVFVSDALIDERFVWNITGTLKFIQDMQGIMEIYFVPPRTENSHIDTVIGIIDNLKILLVDPYYYEEYKKRIDDIAGLEGYEVVTVDESEVDILPTNFVRLDDGRILMNYAPLTLEKIADKVGKKPEEILEKYIVMVPELHITYPSKEEGPGPASIRCMCNKDYPLIEYLRQHGWTGEEIESLIMVREYQSELWEISEDDKVVIKEEETMDLVVNELLLRRLLERDKLGQVSITHLKEIQQNFLELGQEKAAWRIEKYLSYFK